MPVKINSDIHQITMGMGDLLSTMTKPPGPPPLELGPFEELRELIDSIKDHRDGSVAIRKIEKLKKNIEIAEETILKAEERRDHLLTKHNHLQAKSDAFEKRKNDAIRYWENYGFDAKLNDEDQTIYEFIFKKLNQQELEQPITIGLKVHDDRLRIVSRTPQDVLSDEVIEALNKRLESSCRSDNADYRPAMIMIRGALIKHPDALSAQ